MAAVVAGARAGENLLKNIPGMIEPIQQASGLRFQRSLNACRAGPGG
jgi:hypothetical protein